MHQLQLFFWIVFFALPFISSGERSSSRSSAETCKLFMAESTIPNSGMGMFTAVPLTKGDTVAPADIAIAIADLPWHNGYSWEKSYEKEKDFHWMMYQYHWGATNFAPGIDQESKEVDVLSYGFGSLANSHLGLHNVDDMWPTYDMAGLNRHEDPGIGAFTGYHDRNFKSTRELRGGTELFVSYGEDWFRSRVQKLGLLPLPKNFVFAERFLVRYHKIADVIDDAASSESFSESLKNDLWNMIRSEWPWKSRSLNALPLTLEGVAISQEIGLKGAELEASIRPVKWLRENGKCLDNINPKQSTISQAGRGGFATRYILAGDVIAPAPLIHIPYGKESVQMYAPTLGTTPALSNERNYTNIIGQQLLLNYCFGHKQSTMLLCPYSSGVSFINHDYQSPNAKIAWPARPMVHNSTWLEQTVSYIDEHYKSVGLEFDFIATRDIQPGEEILISYGEAWEEAWKKHVAEWIPEKKNDDIIDASTLNCFDDNGCKSTPPIRTEFEQRKEPYPDNLIIKCMFNDLDERADDGSITWEAEFVSD